MAEPASGGADLVAFRISRELMERAQEALRAVREDPSGEQEVEELVDVILELTEGEAR